MMIEDKLIKCKNKKECLEVIKKNLANMLNVSDDTKLSSLLYNAVLVYTSELLEGKRDPKSYKKDVDIILRKYKECSKNPEDLVVKIEDMRKSILNVYPRIKNLPGECNYWDEIIKGTEDVQKKDKYIV